MNANLWKYSLLSGTFPLRQNIKDRREPQKAAPVNPTVCYLLTDCVVLKYRLNFYHEKWALLSEQLSL